MGSFIEATIMGSLEHILLCFIFVGTLAVPCSAGIFGSIWETTVDATDYINTLVSPWIFSEAETGDWPPEFCHDLDCPHFTVVESHDEYEVRRYDASKWARTAFSDPNSGYDSSIRTMFWRLFNYIGGENADSQKIEMTIPVLTRCIPNDAFDAMEHNFTMAFYLALDSAPEPTNSNVHLYDLPEITVYVRHFGGFASDYDYLTEAKLLKDALPEGTPYHDMFFYALGYDSPWTLINRRNEVWYVGTSQ